MSSIPANALPCLYDFQVDTVTELRTRIKRGERRILLVQPTGSGKGTLATWMVTQAAAKGKHVLFLVNRRELVKDTSRRLHRLGLMHGIIMANHGDRRGWLSCHVASIDTLHRREVMPKADLIFVDEAHCAMSPIWIKVLEKYPGVPVIFMTATPVPGMSKIAQSIYIGPSTAELTQRGFLAPAVIYEPKAIDLTGVKPGKDGEYNQEQLALALEKSRIVGDVVDHWLVRGRGLPTVLFAVNCKESRRFVDMFCGRGIRAVHVDAKTPDDMRTKTWAQLASGEVEVVCSVGIISYGWDVPEVACGIDAAPTLKLHRHLQKIGRVIRKHHSKKCAIWLDHAGNCLRHGYPETPREWTLEGARKRPKSELDDAPPVRKCDVCWRTYNPIEYPRGCPECGTAPVKRDVAGPIQQTGELIEATQEKRAAYVIKKLSSNPKLAQLQKTAAAKNFKPGWVYLQAKLQGINLA